MDAGLSLDLPYQAAPFVWGSVQDASGMQLVYQAAPFFITNQPLGATYTYDVRGRLTNVTFTNGTTIVFAYDKLGNRTSVTTTCGPGGC